jgi:hypothetical protein
MVPYVQLAHPILLEQRRYGNAALIDISGELAYHHVSTLPLNPDDISGN